MKSTPQLPTFWSLVLRFSIIFLVIVMGIELFFELFKKGSIDAVFMSFKDNSWIQYILIKGFIALVYGLFMAYITLKRIKKQQS